MADRKERLRGILLEELGAEDAGELEKHLDNLVKAGFTSRGFLGSADKKDLEACGLPHGHVSLLLTKFVSKDIPPGPSRADFQELRVRVSRLASELKHFELFKDLVFSFLDYTEEAATTETVGEFKNTLWEKYSEYKDKGYLRCMLTGIYFPPEFVIGTHIWKMSWNRWRSMVGLDDIHDWRNGMLLLKPIEWAFNNSKLIFIQDVSGQWVAHLLDKSLEDGALITVMEEIDIKCAYSDKTLQWIGARLESHNISTFGKLHGRSLTADGDLQVADPASRLLLFHAKRSCLKALKEKWVGSPDELPEIREDLTPGAWVDRINFLFLGR